MIDRKWLVKWVTGIAVCASAACLPGLAQDAGDNITVGPPPAVPTQEQPQALTSGPVHEAFAEPVNVDVPQPVVAPNQPPANIQETPPAQRPAGDNYVWVPGYWSWDNDRQNYIWVSGCWRVAPPNSYWVPGYWAQAAGGWQWVAGFWAPVQQQELQYQPAPPTIPADQLVAQGAAPTPDDVWVPPCYYWVSGGYVLRNGYWLGAQRGWLWVPSCYRWTPRGHVFCPGHWDYSFEHRGLLFAPVAFQPGFSVGATFVFTPNIVLNLNLVSSNLFVYPRYCHYYFGDYYDPGYVRFGIYAPFDYGHLHGCYDPIYVHDRWLHVRQDPRWEDERRHDYDMRRDNKDLRPARTYQEMEVRAARAPEAERKNIRVAEPLATVAASKTAPMKFEQSNREAQQKLVTHATDVRNYSQQRTQWEAKPGAPAPKPEPRGAVTGAQPPQPAKARPEAQPTGAPPERTAAPAPEHREPAAAAPAAPPARTPEARPPTVVPPGEPKAPAATPERRGRETPAAESAAPAGREDRNQGDRVKVPPSPVSSPQGGGTNPPARPRGDRSSDSSDQGGRQQNR